MQIYKRIALLGAIANPNIGDEAILSANIQLIKKMYGNNCKVYVFSKDSSYTSMYSSEGDFQIIPVDYLHKITMHCDYELSKMQDVFEKLIHLDDIDQCKNFHFRAIHHIFKEIDILHIIGGGYLNSLWPDMLCEVFYAGKLAKQYGKKYIITGISAYPLNIENNTYFTELCENAEFVDFRDNSFQYIGLNDSIKYNMSLDDAFFLEDYYSPLSKETYANILLHDWKNYTDLVDEKIEQIFIPFILHCLQQNIVSKFNILGFAEGDLEIWEKFSFPVELDNRICFINLINKNCIQAKHLIANSKFNIGSRYHLAVFSFSSQIPVLSIYYDEYYKNKIESIHKPYNSDFMISVKDINMNYMVDFINRLDEIKTELKIRTAIIHNKRLSKYKGISNAYGINNVDQEYLLRKLTGNNIDTPKISLIIPIYNMDAYLPECLDSVLNQTLKDFEAICIDDGSTDYTQMILNEYAWKDKRIKVITQSNHGVAYARNVGIESATGEYIFFLDPDDWLPDSEALMDMYTAAKKNNVLICGGTFKEYATRGIIEEWTGNLCKYNFSEDGLMNYADYQFDYGWVRFIYNREFLLYNNLRIPSYKFFEDPVFFVKAMHQAGTFYCLKRCTYCYRTGHKPSELSYEKIVDLMKGLYENIHFAIEHNYNNLLSLELARIENDYAEQIARHLIKPKDEELLEIFFRLNQLLNNNTNRVEYRLFNKIIGNRDAILWNRSRDDSLQKTIDELTKQIQENQIVFYNSTTWKLGNFILYFPKKIKKLFRRQ